MKKQGDTIVTLVVDDDPVYRASVRDILSSLGEIRVGRRFDVHEAHNQAELKALVLERGLQPRLILLDNNFEFGADMSIPDETKRNEGLDVIAVVIQQWKLHGKLPRDTEIILVTAGDHVQGDNPKWLDIGQRAADLGVAEIVPKPFDSARLFGAISQALELAAGGGRA